MELCFFLLSFFFTWTFDILPLFVSGHIVKVGFCVQYTLFVKICFKTQCQNSILCKNCGKRFEINYEIT